MNRFTFKLEQAYSGQPKQTVVLVTDAETLPDILNQFTMFLRGCGFYIGPTDEMAIEKQTEEGV
jgi:hypothetical protein